MIWIQIACFQFCKNDKNNQQLLFPHLEFMLSQMGLKLNVADTIAEILRNNFDLCVQVDNIFISHVMKLICNRGRKRKYVALLSAVVYAEGHVLKENQNRVITMLMKNRDKTLLFLHELRRKSFSTESEEDISEADPKGKSMADTTVKKSIKRHQSKAVLALLEEHEKMDLETFEQIEKETELNQDEDLEDLLYHIELIDLLTKCCLGYNHIPELMCQSLFPLKDCCEAILDPLTDSIMKSAYCKFIREVWLLTESKSNIFSDPLLWNVIDYLKKELLNYGRQRLRDSTLENFVGEGISPLLQTFFSQHFFTSSELSKERIIICNELVSGLVPILKKFHDQPKQLLWLSSILEALKSSGIPVSLEGINLESLIQDAQQRIGTLTSESVRNLKSEAMEEAKRIASLVEFIQERANRSVHGESVRKREFLFLVEMFKKLLLESSSNLKTTHLKGTLRCVERLLTLLRIPETKEIEVKVKVVCLKILTAMTDTELVHKHSEDVARKEEDIETVAADKRRRQEHLEMIQEKLMELHVLEVAMSLLRSSSKKVVSNALKLCAGIFVGGNRFVQERMLKTFLANQIEALHFLEHIRERIAYAVSDLKNRRQSSRIELQFNEKPIQTLETDQIVSIITPTSKQKEDPIILVFRFLQNMCEGHYTEMKDFLREQGGGSNAVDIVKDTAMFALELERSIGSNISLGIALFRLLNEFASGCTKNCHEIVDSKVVFVISRLLVKYKDCSDSESRKLLLSLFTLLLSLVEGQAPGLPSSNAIPHILLKVLDFEGLEFLLSSAFEIFSNKDYMLTQLPYLDDDEHVKEEIITEEDSNEAKEILSSCLMLLKVLQRFDSGKVSPLFEGQKWSSFAEENIASIEIINEKGNLEPVLFPIPEICHNLTNHSKRKLLHDVNRDSASEKIEDFVKRSDTLIFEINHQTQLMHHKWSRLVQWESIWRDILLLITIAINVLNVVFYSLDANGNPVIPTKVSDAILFLALLHILFSTLWTSMFIWKHAPTLLYCGKVEKAEEERNRRLIRELTEGKDEENETPEELLEDAKREEKEEEEVKLNWWESVEVLFSDSQLVYHLLYWALSVVGAYWPPLYAWHLLDFAFRNEAVKNVVQAVTKNGYSIIMTAVLIMIVVFLYATIGFFFLQSSYTGKDFNCGTLYQCFINTLNYGLRDGGIGDALAIVSWSTIGLFFGRFFFDLTFYMFINVIGLNMVFGIILDTFGQLRDDNAAIEDDIHSKCFICNIPCETFDRQALGFDDHIKHDHNMWQYLFLFIYLDLKDSEQYTFVEDYIARKRDLKQSDYFPILRSICLEKNGTKPKNTPAVS